MRSTIDNQVELIVLPMENEILCIEELWASMPMTSKQYYGYDVDVYRHHKIIQAMRDSEE